MSLTSPLIEQAFAQACAFISLRSVILSAIGIFQPSEFELVEVLDP